MANGKGKDVAVVEETQTGLLVSADVASFLEEHADETQAFSLKDMATPFLQIVQGLSPQRDAGSPKYLGPECVEGMLFNSVTGDLFDGKVGAEMIPCSYELVYNEWHDRNAPGGGGFVAKHATEAEAMANKLPDTYIADTAVYHVLLRNPLTGDLQPIVLSMKSTSMKVSRAFNSQLAGLRVEVRPGKKVSPPMFMTRWQVTTVQERNKKNQPYYNYKLSYNGLVASVEEAATAREFRELVVKGEIETKFGTEGDAPATDTRPAF